MPSKSKWKSTGLVQRTIWPQRALRLGERLPIRQWARECWWKGVKFSFPKSILHLRYLHLRYQYGTCIALIRGDCPNPTFLSKRRRRRAPRYRLGLRKGSLESLKGALEACRATFALHATHAYFFCLWKEIFCEGWGSWETATVKSWVPESHPATNLARKGSVKLRRSRLGILRSLIQPNLSGKFKNRQLWPTRRLKTAGQVQVIPARSGRMFRDWATKQHLRWQRWNFPSLSSRFRPCISY